MSSQEATTPPPVNPMIRRLTRRRDNKVIAGVCSGLGDYTGLDPIIFRIAFVVMAVMGGSGLLLYGIAWLLIPETGSEHAHAHALLSRFGSTPWIGVALLIGGGALLLSQTGLWRPPVVWGCALLVLGIVLFREHEERPSPGPMAATPPPPSGAYSSSLSTARPAETSAVLPTSVAAPRPRRERSALGWYTIAAALLALGIAALLDSSNTVHIRLVQYLALPLVIVGAGLIVGAWLGRSRLLIFLGILLVPVVLAASLIHVPLTGAAGRFVYRPQTISDIPPRYHIAAGQLNLDLRRLSLPKGTTDISATVGAGEVRVLVPPHVPLSIDGRAGVGTVNILGIAHAGTGIRFLRSASPPPSVPSLHLDLEAGLGDVRIERVPTGTALKPGVPAIP